MHTGRWEGALLGTEGGTWGPGGSELVAKFGLKGHTNIHLLPAFLNTLHNDDPKHFVHSIKQTGKEKETCVTAFLKICSKYQKTKWF